MAHVDDLYAIQMACRLQDMNMPDWELHPLKGELAGRWSVRVSGNWGLEL